jgi:hypothetical protein
MKSQTITLPRRTKIRITTPSDCKDIEIKGAKSTATKKIADQLGIPGEEIYKLKKTGSCAYQSAHGFEVKVEVIEVIEAESLTREQFLERVKQREEIAKVGDGVDNSTSSTDNETKGSDS